MRLNDWLKTQGITRVAFARQIGVTHGAVCKWCAGRRPDWPQMLAIHDATGGMVQPNDWLPEPTTASKPAEAGVAAEAAA
jgi:3,4-dihydroxy 2-butanone 4-phosphate synthase / GTP cyclohydrolase II